MVDVVDPPSEWSEQVMVASMMVYIIIPELFAGVHPVPAGQQAHPFCVGTKPPAADKLSTGGIICQKSLAGSVFFLGARTRHGPCDEPFDGLILAHA